MSNKRPIIIVNGRLMRGYRAIDLDASQERIQAPEDWIQTARTGVMHYSPGRVTRWATLSGEGVRLEIDVESWQIDQRPSGRTVIRLQTLPGGPE